LWSKKGWKRHYGGIIIKGNIFISKDGTKHYGGLIDKKGEFTVINCENCRFKHIIPIPEQEELEKLYKDQFYSSKKPMYFKEMEEDKDWWELHYNLYYDLIEKNLNSNAKKLLEIGSGPGFFLKVGKERGWDVMGFEPSELAYQYSNKFGLHVINDFFNVKKALEYGKFDIVYMNTVIEHVADPKGLIEDVKSILKKGGLFCIIAPNDYNPLQNTLRNNLNLEPYWVAPPQHINYFNFQSMKKLLEDLDFTAIDSLATFPMEFFILSGKNYVNNGVLGRKCHYMRKNFEMNLGRHDKELLFKFYNFLAENEMGREFVVIAKLTK
jgi:SAM-dependent methyltransferase